MFQKREMKLLGLFLLFVGGFGLMYLKVKYHYPLSVAKLGGIVSIGALILMVPILYKLRIEATDIQIKASKWAYGNNWFYGFTLFALLFWVSDFVPINYRNSYNVFILFLLAISIMYVLIKKQRRKL